MNDDKNTNSGEPWESEMADEFDRRVRDLHEAPLTIKQVRGRAVNIRRKRRAAVAGSILAAAAVVVPVAVLAASPDGDETRRPVQPATTGTDAPSPTPTPEPPRVPSYVEGASFHLPDGSVFELPAATYEHAAALGDRVVASRLDQDSGITTVDMIEGDTVTGSFEAASDFVVSDAGESVAFVTTDGTVERIWEDTTSELAGGYPDWRVTAVSGGADCVPGAGTGCQVYLVDQNKAQAVALDSAGNETKPVADALQVADADAYGQLSVLNQVDDAGSCGGVYDIDAGAYAFETCEFTVQKLSPDGSLVTGAPAYLDGVGDSWVAVLDATTGDEVARLDPSGDTVVNRSTWLDDDTIAVMLFDYVDLTYSIVTQTIGDDQPVTVVAPVKSDDNDAPFFLND